MATAPQKASVGKSASHGVRIRPGVGLKFRVEQDNDGGYHWEIVGARDENLARSESFASYEDASRAARSVRYGARSARREEPVAQPRPLPVD